MKIIVKTVFWSQGKLSILDQTLLPSKIVYIRCTKVQQVYEAIKKLKVRGAPAIGVAAAWGIYVGIKNSKTKSADAFRKELNRAAAYLASSRPTARNLFWAIEKVIEAVDSCKNQKIPALKKAVFNEAKRIADEDRMLCERIGRFGEKLIKNGDTIVTHCNAGSLATAGIGTALSPVYAARARGKKVRVFANETRPLLQGSRLTTWELIQNKIPVTLICDNMSGSVMRKEKIDMVIVGADRIAANGDAANKIGTYSLAVLARHHKIPFYVAAPFSTFDFNISKGKDIPIEERHADEIRRGFGKWTAPKKVPVFNPAFDVTPNNLISAIITDRGVFYPPYSRSLKKLKNSRINKITKSR